VRNVVIHYNLFKNAGTSIDTCLSTHFGAGWQSFDRPTGWSNITTSDLLAFLRERPAVQALSSHQARWPEPRSDDIHAYPIVFLRHPIDQVGSIYSYGRRIGDPRMASRTFKEYVEWQLGPASDIVFRSFQTLFLSDDDHLCTYPESPITKVTSGHFDSAVRRLNDLPAFGLVEQFDASLAMLTASLADPFPELVLQAHRDNTSSDRTAAPLERRISDIEEGLGGDLYRQPGRVQRSGPRSLPSGFGPVRRAPRLEQECCLRRKRASSPRWGVHQRGRASVVLGSRSRAG
jgi:hypothetical protein